MTTADFIREHHACRRGAEWALSISDDMADVWDAMIKQNRHDWLLWAAIKPGVFPDSTLRKLACRFVRETPLLDGRKVWDLLADERSRKAVEVAEAYAEGSATDADLSAAYAAATAARAADAASAAALAADAAASCVAADYFAFCASVAAYTVNAVRAAASCVAADYFAFCASVAAYTVNAVRAARAAARAASSAAAKAAQVQMIAELGNPFKERR